MYTLTLISCHIYLCFIYICYIYIIDFGADLGRGYAMRVLQGCVRIEDVMYYFMPCQFRALYFMEL